MQARPGRSAGRASALLASLRSGDWISAERIRTYSVLLLALFTVAITTFWVSGAGLLDPRSEPIGTDFANPYAAGRMALEGRAADVYDWPRHYAMQQTIFRGGESQPYYGWHYPPIFLLIAAPLAALPYIAALLLWLVATFTLYLATIWALLPHRLALLAAAAAPTTFITVGHGQNAFLTAGLLGLGLMLIERRPWLAGVLFGCLSYKPHLALVLPLILAAGGHWRAFAAAALTTVALCVATMGIFGADPWLAFLESGGLTRTQVLENVSTGWFKIASLFSAVRGFNGSVTLAYAAQGTLAAAVLATLALIWRTRSGRSAQAAVCIGALLVTPYVLDYDLVLLMPAIALLAADGLEHGFRPYEKTLLAAVWAAPLFARLAAGHLHLPLGLLAIIVLFVLAASREFGGRSGARTPTRAAAGLS